MRYLLIITAFFPYLLWSHPHMFVDVETALSAPKDDQLIIKVRWYFDEFTSAGLIVDYDQNENGRLEAKEKQFIGKDFAQGLKKANYFTTLSLNSKKQKFEIQNIIVETAQKESDQQSVQSILGKRAKRAPKKVTVIYYQFDMILKEKLLPKNNNLTLSFYDSTIYSVLSPLDKMSGDNTIKIKENTFTKNRCLFTVGFDRE